MENNKKIVEKAKKTLNELGYDVKTTHLYEFFSKMSDYNSYSVAKAKGVDFNGVLSKIKNVLNISKPLKEFDNDIIKNILEMYKKGELNDKFFLGYKEKDNNPLLLNFAENPNALFVGKMGTGKTQALKFTLFSWMIANSHKTQLFIVDTLKAAGDLSIFFKNNEKGEKYHSQVVESLGSIEKAKLIIDLVYEEYVERQKLFKTVNASSSNDYEKKTGKTLNRILTVLCEAHNIFDILKFEETFKKDYSTSWKLWVLLRVGRAAGIWFMLDSQKGTKEYIPSQIINNFNNLVFKTSLTESSYLIGSSDAGTIKDTEQGRCLSEFGFINFPFLGLDDDLLSGILSRYAKPLEGDFAFLNSKMIKDVIENDHLKEFYKNKKMADLATYIEHYDASLVISTIHEKLGQKIEEIKDENITHILKVNNKLSVGVLVRAKFNTNQITPRHIHGLIKAMAKNELKKGIIYTSSSNITAQIYKMAKEFNIEIVDHEDLIKLAVKVDNYENLDFLAEDIEQEEDNSLELKLRNIKIHKDYLALACEMFKTLGYGVEELKDENILGISHIIRVSPEIKMAVLIRSGDNDLVTEKHINNVIKAYKIYDCNKGIILTTLKITVDNHDMFNKVGKLAIENNIEIVDYEDWIQFCKRIDKDKS